MKKILSVILVVCIMMVSFSCTTTKLISIEEASNEPGSQNFLILRTPKQSYALNNPNFTNDFIEGKIQRLSRAPKNVIYIYTNRLIDVDLQGDASEYVKIENKDISKIIHRRYNRNETIIMSVAIPSIIIALLIIWAANMTFSVNLL